MSSQNRMRKELRSDKATRRPAWDDSDVGEAPVKKTNPRKPTSGKSSTERLASSRRPPSPVSSRRGGHVSEKSHSHHLPTPESSRNRTPNSEDDDLTEESDTDDTESDKGKQSAPHRPAEKTSATLGSKKGRHSSAAPTPSESTRPAGKKSKPTAASKRYDSETSGFDDLSDHSSDLSPGVFSEQDSDETGLDSVDRAMRETRRERRRSSARRAARARSKSVPPAADRWNDKKSKRDSTERKSRTTTGRGVTGASSKNKTSRGLVKPPLQILSCTDCSVQTDSAGINKLDCGDYLCNRCLKKRFKESVNNPNKFPPQCCKLDIPLKLANRFDENFRKTFNRRLAQHNRTKHTRRASSDPGDDLDDNRRFDEFTVPRPRRRAPKWNDRDRDEVGSGSARTAPTPRREAIKIKGWQHCYNCASTVEQREGEPSITCRCGAIFCTICGAKWKHCNCDSISYDPLLDSIDNDYHDVAQDFPPPDNMAYPRMMRDHQRVAGRVAGGPAVAGAEYYSAAARGGVRDHVRDAPRGGDYDMTGYDEFDDMDYAAAAPRPGVRDYAGGRDRTREPSTGQERAFAVNSARERMEIPMASRDRALAAAAGYGAQEYDYPEYPEYDESYDLPTGAAAGNMAAYRQDNYRREAVAANAAAAAEYTDRRAFGARRPGMAMAGGARPAPAPVYDDDYEDEYHPPAHSRYPAEKYATTAAAANGYMDEYDDYPEQAAMSARYPQSARQAPKYAGDEYERQRPAAYGGAHGGYVDEDMYEADEFRNGPPARAPSARAPSARAPSARAVAAAAAAAAAVANGFGRRAPMHANYEDDMMDDVDDMHDPRDAMEPRPARETREPMESREPRAPMRRKDPRSSVPPPATTRLRHSVAAPGYEDDSRRAVAKPQGNELVLNRRPGRGDEMDEDDESDGGYEAPPPPRRHQSVRARGARGGAMAATDDDIYDDYDRRMPSGPGLERHSMAGDLPPKGRRGARGASAGLADRFAHRNSMPPSPRTAPPFGGHMNGHGPHHGGPPMGGGPAMAPMGGPMGMGPGPMGGPMGGGPMGPGPMGGGPMRGPPPMGMGGPMGMGMGGPMGGPMGPGPGMPPMGPGMGPMGMGPGPMGPGGPMGGPPGMGPGAMTPYGRPPPPGGLPPQVPGAPLIHPPYRDDMYGPGGPGGPPRGDLMSPGGRHPGRGPPPPMEYDDEAAAGHGPSRRRRRYDAESDNVKSSTMAGLTGVGTGMTRVSEWVVHVPPGRPSPSLTAPR